ncbi:bifunctional UDP-2,4-diacetamido-2,4,6-trideoxy-beta-L-altropyranose hydrolase/GNAT family N-acetyltransferase [Actinokineospora sp. UTMC 2448]|uniref:bifunctional UDP-2,4-diacetamido-2,4,6-trideoxy-beta-L-altropyranose hydrolase/GNAT family N-acetyltransferase n=1 Tax=Actinokineospora sp. UTMC 2448 TaxID=2268449 RepID=UPI002207925C|nr:bifunctional UDP-2,4-diacetamido-2,4,6-trideoxy-beta-L-altropyranose hydrolase/GNAT family N-acetyltransferase [Actinokineospora sp. UTMC 2448]UVS76489.1 undecaprenyldiphospho-muramoylpentapeptide beta-N- acetylglucosaminyltransferase [Actinokineospora sp. UTMC 2448]
MRLLLRADANPTIGAGHLARCVAIAEEAVARGWTVTLTGTLTGVDWLTTHLAALGVEIRPDWTDADIVLIDHYGAITPPEARLVSLEDGPHGRRKADVAVDCNLAPTPRPADGTPLILRGPTYAPIRTAVRTRRAHPTPSSHLRVVVSMGGGTTPHAVSAAVAALHATNLPLHITAVSTTPLNPTATRFPRFPAPTTVEPGDPPDRLAPAEAGGLPADRLALTEAGGLPADRLAPADTGGLPAGRLAPIETGGLPADRLASAEGGGLPTDRLAPIETGGLPAGHRPTPAAEAIAPPSARSAPVEIEVVRPHPDLPALLASADLVISAAGVTLLELCCLGVPTAVAVIADNQIPNYTAAVAQGLAAGLGDLTSPAAVDTLHHLLTTPTARHDLARAASRAVDGHGARRILDAAAQLTVRRATPADADRLLAWRNDPGTRRWSVNPDPVSPETHRRWLAQDRRLLIAEEAGVPVGVVRFDPVPGGVEVSITIAPEARGRGLARPILQAAQDTVPGTRLLARVHADNTASRRLFASAGYRLVTEDRPFLTYRY